MMRLIFVFVLLTHLGSDRAQAAKVLAEINNQKITLEYFNKRYRDGSKFFPLSPPTKSKVLEEMIQKELAVQEAKRLKIDQDPLIQERLNNVLYQALVEKQLGRQVEKIKISNAEAKSYYSKNPEIRASHIFVPVRPGATKKEQRTARKKIQSILDKHVKPGKKTFAEIAQKFSDDVTAPMGGDLDYQTKDKLDPNFYAAAKRLKKGQISGIVKSRFGYHIIRLANIRSWKETDQAKIKRLVFEEKRKRLFENYMGKLRKNAKVKINRNLLK